MINMHGSVLVLVDLSAAFDTVDHNLLLHSLSVMGIRGRALAWFQSYLDSRTQQVHINGHPFSPTTLRYAVPQGSILGPVLFTIYSKPIGHICKLHDMV